MTNSVTKENLTTLGNLLRDSNKIKNLSIVGLGKRKVFNSDKKEFCNAILRLLKDGRILQISMLKDEDYFGMNNPNIKNFINSEILEEIQISVITEASTKKEDPSNWTLD